MNQERMLRGQVILAAITMLALIFRRPVDLAPLELIIVFGWGIVGTYHLFALLRHPHA